MSPRLHILRDLLAGRSTADSIFQRVSMPEPAVAAILRREGEAGRVEWRPLGPLCVWQLTPDGTAYATPVRKRRSPRPALAPVAKS